MIIMRIIITRFWQGRLSEEDTGSNPTRNTAWDGRIFC